jgi:hypothetical protein
MPSQLDTTPSKCPYIVKLGNPGEHVCGAKSKSGLLCAEHRKRKRQVHVSDKEEEENDDSFMSRSFSRLVLDTGSTRESTPEADTPTRPSTERSKNQGRHTRESIPVTDTPPRLRTARSTPSSASATEIPTSTERNSTPRRSTRNSTPKATPKSASTRKPRSSLPGADSTSTEISGDGIEELTGQLKDLNVGDEDDIDPHSSYTESQVSASVTSCGPHYLKYDKYMPKDLHSWFYQDILAHLSSPLWDNEEAGYVYVVQAIPYKGEVEKTVKNVEEERIIIKIGASKDVEQRINNLSGTCSYYRYKDLKGWPKVQRTALKYKAEKLVHAHMDGFHYESKCLCRRRHTEFFELNPKELKVVFESVKHWTSIVNDYKDEIWPEAVNLTLS